MADTYAVAVTLTKHGHNGEINIVNWLDIFFDCASEDEARGAGVRMAQCDNPTHARQVDEVAHSGSEVFVGAPRARWMRLRNQAMPLASTLAHCAAVRRMERCSSRSSGGVGGLPRPRFCSSMAGSVNELSNHKKELAKLHLLNHNKCINRTPGAHHDPIRSDPTLELQHQSIPRRAHRAHLQPWVRSHHHSSVAVMVPSERREALLQAAAQWRAYAATCTRKIGAPAAIAAAVSLEREAEDGVARCSCCMKPFGQGTLHR